MQWMHYNTDTAVLHSHINCWDSLENPDLKQIATKWSLFYLLYYLPPPWHPWDLSCGASSGAWVSIFFSGGSFPTVLKHQYPLLCDHRPHQSKLMEVLQEEDAIKGGKKELVHCTVCACVLCWRDSVTETQGKQVREEYDWSLQGKQAMQLNRARGK